MGSRRTQPETIVVEVESGPQRRMPTSFTTKGNPDNSAEGDLGAVNKVMLRTEVAIGWGFIGGTSKFYAITHTTE